MEEKSSVRATKPGSAGFLSTDDFSSYTRADYLAVSMSYHEKIAHKYWRDVFFCGTELDHYDRLFAKPWLFPHLGEDLDDDGVLYKDILGGRNIYLFGVSEPKIVGQEFLPVPVICAVSSVMPLPEQVGIKSVQMNSIDVLSFNELNLFFREEVLGFAKPNGKPKQKISFKTLALTRRMSSVDFMSEYQLNRYKYANLYLFRPDIEEKELMEMVEPTNVTVDVTLRKTTVTDLYEEKEDPTEAAKHLVSKHFKGVPCSSAELSQIAKKLKESMNEEKGRYKAKVADIKRRIGECSEDYRSALKTMRIIKYYPYLDNERVEIRTNKLINRFYGDATEVKGGSSPYETREEFEQRIQALEAKRAEKLRRSKLAEERREQRMAEMKRKRESNQPKKKLTRADRIKILEAELEKMPDVASRKKKEADKVAARAKAARERAAAARKERAAKEKKKSKSTTKAKPMPQAMKRMKR